MTRHLKILVFDAVPFSAAMVARTGGLVVNMNVIAAAIGYAMGGSLTSSK